MFSLRLCDSTKDTLETASIWGSRIEAIAPDCKSGSFGIRWFESNLPHHLYAFVAQPVEYVLGKHEVTSSSLVESSRRRSEANREAATGDTP